MDDRFHALAALAVHGVNVQLGQLVGIGATVGQEEMARALAEAAYRRGARYVDVVYFDPYVKRARIEHAAEDTLEFRPEWYVQRLLALAAEGGARIGLSGVVTPHALDGVDPVRLGRDQMPWLKESSQVIAERSTNWLVVPAPTRDWGALVFPELDGDAAYERLWTELWHVLRLDEPDPAAAWEERIGTLKRSAATLGRQGFDALEYRGPGTDLTIGLFQGADWHSGDQETRDGLRFLPNLPTEEVFTSPDPMRADGHVTSTKPLVLKDGTIVRGLRVRFEGGKAVEIDADENGAALRSKLEIDDGATRLGELALVDGEGRIGKLGTVFYDTLLDENAASHIALGNGFPFAVRGEDADRVNRSGIHIDFMIGSPELEVTGITPAGERVPVLRDGAWQI